MQSNNTGSFSGGIRLRVSDFLFAFQKRWMVIVALSLVGLVFGLILSAMTYVQSSFQAYEVSGSFAITTLNANNKYLNNNAAANNYDYHLAEDMVDAVRYILTSNRVLSEVINDQELIGFTVKQISNALYLSQYNLTQILEMRLTWRNAEEGIAIWNAILRFANELMPDTLQVGTLAVINEPQAELVGVGSSSNSPAMLLTALGFMAGVGFAVIELLMHPTLNNVKDVETMFGLETIGIIPRDDDYFKRRGSLLTRDENDSSHISQSFSAASYILRNRLGSQEAHHCFYVTSATAREGRSTVAANLAIQLSDMERRTLLIDFDTRNPSLGSLFLNKVDYAHSLNALYRGEATEEEVITTLTGYLDILPAVLEHNAMVMDGSIVELFQRLCQKYEYVILDAPPVGEVSDVLSLNQIASTVLYVIGYDNSTIPQIQNALEKLEKSGIRVLGCVVNAVQSTKDFFDKDSDARKRKKRSAGKKATVEEAFVAAEQAQPPVEGLSGGKAKAAEPAKDKKGKKRKKKDAKASAPAARRNVMDDLIDQEETADALTDEDTVSVLLKMGVEGEFGEKKGTDAPSGPSA